MTIPNYRLPVSIERGARGGPDHKTLIQEAISGKEKRIAQWSKARRVYDIAYAVSSSRDPLADFFAVLAVHLAHQGRLQPFRFKDWSDYIASEVEFGTGTGAQTVFQLIKVYNPWDILGSGLTSGLTCTRSITCIVGTPVIEMQLVSPAGWFVTTAWSLDADTGIVTFDTPPPLDCSVRWTGEFDVPVRFDSDHLPAVMQRSDLGAIGSITIREVLGE